jgi:hypothetical protein
MGLDMPEIYNLLNLSETLYAQVLRGELSVARAEEKPKQDIEVVAVTVATGEKTRTKVVRGWDAAAEHIQGLLRNKVSVDNHAVKDFLAFEILSMPSNDDLSQMSMDQTVEWIIENNSTERLIMLIGSLTDGRTRISMSNDWI